MFLATSNEGREQDSIAQMGKRLAFELLQHCKGAISAHLAILVENRTISQRNSVFLFLCASFVCRLFIRVPPVAAESGVQVETVVYRALHGRPHHPRRSAGLLLHFTT